MTMAKDAIKGPDMSRNTALAGKTVYSRGRNVHYDLDGYAVWAENPKHPSFAGTTKSAHAQPIEDALAGKPSNEDWTGLIYWNHGNPIGPALTKENEAEVRAQYYAEIAADDEARRKGDEEPDLAGQHEMPDDH